MKNGETRDDTPRLQATLESVILSYSLHSTEVCNPYFVYCPVNLSYYLTLACILCNDCSVPSGTTANQSTRAVH